MPPGKRVKDKNAVDVCDSNSMSVNHDTHHILTPNEFRLNEVIKLIVGTDIEFVWSGTCQQPTLIQIKHGISV